MSDYSKVKEPVTIEQTAMTWMVIYGHCCLARRHSQNNDPSRAMIEGVLAEIEKKLIECGIFTEEEFEMIRRFELEGIKTLPTKH